MFNFVIQNRNYTWSILLDLRIALPFRSHSSQSQGFVSMDIRNTKDEINPSSNGKHGLLVQWHKVIVRFELWSVRFTVYFSQSKLGFKPGEARRWLWQDSRVTSSCDYGSSVSGPIPILYQFLDIRAIPAAARCQWFLISYLFWASPDMPQMFMLRISQKLSKLNHPRLSGTRTEYFHE